MRWQRKKVCFNGRFLDSFSSGFTENAGTHQGGKLGEIRYIRSEYGFVAKGDRKVRKFNPQLGGGALLDIRVSINLGFFKI